MCHQYFFYIQLTVFIYTITIIENSQTWLDCTVTINKEFVSQTRHTLHLCTHTYMTHLNGYKNIHILLNIGGSRGCRQQAPLPEGLEFFLFYHTGKPVGTTLEKFWIHHFLIFIQQFICKCLSLSNRFKQQLPLQIRNQFPQVVSYLLAEWGLCLEAVPCVQQDFLHPTFPMKFWV